MNFSTKIDQLHLEAKQNRWLHYFAIFNRIVLALGFIPAGMVKILGYRFADGLSVIHPMGHYLEALLFTGYYYTFIGVAQILAGVFLLIPRTVTLGAVIYFPIILNICILSFSVRFDGSLLTAPLMVLANLYLLCWNYDKIKYILPFKIKETSEPQNYSNRFPLKFFAGVIVSIFLVVAMVIGFNRYAIMPRNSEKACKRQFEESLHVKEGYEFCRCIHIEGGWLDKCLQEYKIAVKK